MSRAGGKNSAVRPGPPGPLAPVLSVEHISMRFGGLLAVADFSLTLQPGDLVGLIGPNGAGKTTVFNMISGTVKPTGGKIFLQGDEITGLKPSAITRRGIARTFQNIRLFRDLKVLENVMISFHGNLRSSFIGAVLLKERVRLEHIIAFFFVAGGMAAMFMDKLAGGGLLGNVLAVLSGLTFSFYFVFMRMQKDGSPLESILLSHALTAVVGIGATLFLPAPRVTWAAVGAIAVLGIVQVGLSAVLFAFAIKRISAVSANLIAIIEPVFNPVWVFLALGEAPGARAIAGGAVIIVAVTAASVISARRADNWGRTSVTKT